ncbi:hypothetical protein V6N13_113686 [Hibiscus sabdariffa]
MRRARTLHKATLEARLIDLEEQEPDDNVLEKLISVKLGLNLEADKVELTWEQRARVNWISFGDKNMTFFHQFATARKRTNTINDVENDRGVIVTSTEENLNVAVTYFTNLFSKSSIGDASNIYENVHCNITSEMNDVLSMPFKRSGIIEDHDIDIRFLKVADLIDPAHMKWNVNLVRSLFDSSLLDRILCISLAQSKPPDTLVWRIEGSGQYTPKSGYRLLNAEDIQNQGGKYLVRIVFSQIFQGSLAIEHTI